MKENFMLEKLDTLPVSLLAYADRNQGTLWQVVKGYLANQRQGTVGVKTRSMVKSTGKKPYKQKKTGNARRGSFVAPLHVGGGVAHGPQARDYREFTPKKMSKLALGLALTTRINSGAVFLGDLNVTTGKTKDAYQFIKNSHELKAGASVLVCIHKPSVETIRAFRNLRNVTLVSPEQLNAYHVMQTRSLITTRESLQLLEARLTEKENQGE